MTVPIMANEQHFNVLTHQEWLSRLKTFMQNQGWTIVRHLENVQWQAGTGFVAGTEFFLEVNSNGFGNQTLHFRLRLTDNTTENKRLRIEIGYGDTTLDTPSSQHPVNRFFKPGTGFTTPLSGSQIETFVSALAMPQVYYFGFGQKYVASVIVLDTQKAHLIHFGTLDVHDLNSDYGAFSVDEGVLNWQTTDVDNVLGIGSFQSFRMPDGTNGGFGNNKYATEDSNDPHREKMSIEAFNGGGIGDIVIQNKFSELTPQARNHHYVEDPVDSRWYFFARDWCYRVNVIGKPIGHRFKISTEEYISFPNFDVNQSKYGYAFRVL